MNQRLEKVINLPLHQQLGVKQISSSEGIGELPITVNESAVNPNGFLHGGIVYLLADVCAYAGLLSMLDPEQDAVTHDIHVSVIRPATLGDSLLFQSKVIRLGKRIAFLEVQVLKDNSIIASARVTKSIV